MSRITPTAAPLAGLCACLALAVSGCGAISPHSPRNTPDARPTFAILSPIGATAAVPAAERQHAVSTVLAAATADRARLVVDGITASGQGTPLADDVLTGTGPNTLMRKVSLSRKQTAISHAVDQLSQGTPPARLDIIAALNGLSHQLATAAHGPVDVALIGSAVPANPLGAGDVRLSDPAAAINTLVRAGLVMRCSGWRVAAVAPQFTPAGRPLTAVESSQLERFYTLLFARCGGRLVAWTDQLLSYPGRSALPGVETALVNVRHGRDATYITLRSDVAFAVDSAALTAAAQRALTTLVPLLHASRGSVTVTGYTDSTGTDAINVALSKRRAGSVAQWITRHAAIPAARVASAGRGDTDPVASNATAAGRAKNRRVVIAIQGTRQAG